ncbi:acyltransferase [Curtobacterium sp. ISL-83]|uniref:acyltransferase family protein n=1 Tax=Curtobacterium sp. ISL-83 TaxID=2819145 RepID=UPI001BE87BD7|nr:acyltransferase [Curtobacterium sp. ISL-83]MBT2502616.1 acyltransferase [Curtobacterium sp. ISL-83]
MSWRNGSCRTTWLDTAKGFAILGIVLIHAASWAPGQPSVPAEWILDRLVVSLPLFFVASGVVGARSLTEEAAGARLVAARVAPLLYLYILWQPAVLGYRMLGDLVLHDRIDLIGELIRFAAAPLRPNGEIWYLWALAIHFVLVWATRRVPAVLVLGPSFALFVVLDGWGRTLLGDHLWHVLGPGLQGLPQFAFFTLIGARFAGSIIAMVERAGLPVIVLVIAGWLAAGRVPSVAPVTVAPLGPVKHLFGVAAVLLLSRLADLSTWIAPLRTIGRYSVVPYLTHTAVIVVMLAIAGVVGLLPVAAAHPTITTFTLMATASVLVLVVYLPVRSTRASLLFTAPARFRVPRP